MKQRHVQKHVPNRTWACGGANLVSDEFKRALNGEPWMPAVVADPTKGRPPHKPCGKGGFSKR